MLPNRATQSRLCSEFASKTTLRKDERRLIDVESMTCILTLVYVPCCHRRVYSIDTTADPFVAKKQQQYLTYDHDGGEKCFFPSVDSLDRIYAHYPNATFINIVRDKTAWYTSLKNWSSSSLFVRFRLCNATNFPNGQSVVENWLALYEWQNEMVRQFARDHPSLTYVELQLESSETGRILEETVGIESSCWKQCLPQQPRCVGDTQNIQGATRSLGAQKASFPRKTSEREVAT
jgi:hypothetical protein